MEPANIDWNHLDSRFERDETYENISAPMWLDLSAPESIPVDDDVWFCRPDCKHPKTAEDFFKLSPSLPCPKGKLMRSSSERLPLGQRNSGRWDENNLKRRGGIAAAMLRPASPLKPKAAPGRKFRQDLENQDPNLSAPPSPARPLGAALKGRNSAKQTIKSSAEKKVEEESEVPRQKRAQPRLKSTLSARNLFSGRDILSQIFEFCHEIKKMATGRTQHGGEAEQKELKVADILHNEEAEDTKLLTPKKDDAAKRIATKMAARKELEKSRPLKEVRESPPTPQRFPSPSNRSLKNPKATPSDRTPLSLKNDQSPLGKPPKPTTLGRAILQEVDRNKEEEDKALLAGIYGDCKSAADDANESSADLFWFLKPCSYLV